MARPISRTAIHIEATMGAMKTGTVHAAQVSNASLRAVNTPKPALMSLPDH